MSVELLQYRARDKTQLQFQEPYNIPTAQELSNWTPLERTAMRRDQLLARERESEGDLVAVRSNASMCGLLTRGSLGW